MKINQILDKSIDQILNDLTESTVGDLESLSSPIGYHIVDGQTGKVIGKYSAEQRNRARARRDKLDNAYGAYRYKVVPIYAEKSTNEGTMGGINRWPGGYDVSYEKVLDDPLENSKYERWAKLDEVSETSSIHSIKD